MFFTGKAGSKWQGTHFLCKDSSFHFEVHESSATSSVGTLLKMCEKPLLLMKAVGVQL